MEAAQVVQLRLVLLVRQVLMVVALEILDQVVLILHVHVEETVQDVVRQRVRKMVVRPVRDVLEHAQVAQALVKDLVMGALAAHLNAEITVVMVVRPVARHQLGGSPICS